jgi:hypothetical protein
MADGSEISGQWRLSSLVDYYDFNQDCPSQNCLRLAALNEQDRAIALSTVEQTVAGFSAAFDDGLLPQVASSVVDDLYKYGSTSVWGPLQWDYIRAVWGTFFSELRSRGFNLRYVVENTFPDPLQRPIELFPNLFGAAGLIYICPHELALKLPEGVHVEPSLANLRFLVAEARDIAGRLAKECVEQGKHFAYLELDYDEGSLATVNGLAASPGSIQIFRNLAPTAGSTIQVVLVPKS